MSELDTVLGGLASGQTQALTGLQGAEAGLKIADLTMQQKFMQGMAGLQQGQAQQNSPVGMTNNLDKMASLALGAGQVQKAAELSETATRMRVQMANMAHNNMLVQNEQLQLSKNQLDFAGQLYSGVTDPQSKQQADTLFYMRTGQQSPWAQQPWSPDLPQKIAGQSLTVNQRLERQVQIANQERLNSVLELRQQHEQSYEDQNTIRNNLAEQRMQVAAKTGSLKASEPTATDITSARQLWDTMHPSIGKVGASSTLFGPNVHIGEGQGVDYGYQLAAAAKQAMHSNPALQDMGQAMNWIMSNTNITKDKDGHEIMSGGIGGVLDNAKAGTSKPAVVKWSEY